MPCTTCGHTAFAHAGFGNICQKSGCECRKFLMSGSANVPVPIVETLRDRFAMAALTGLISGTLFTPEVDVSTDLIATAAYDIADAMMEARDA